MSIIISAELKNVVLNFWNLYFINDFSPTFFYFSLFWKKMISSEAVAKAGNSKIVRK